MSANPVFAPTSEFQKFNLNSRPVLAQDELHLFAENWSDYLESIVNSTQVVM